MANRYTIMLKHPSIARSRTVTVDGTLGQAQRRAMQEFRDEQVDYRIVIYLHPRNGDEPYAVTSRRVGSTKGWSVVT